LTEKNFISNGNSMWDVTWYWDFDVGHCHCLGSCRLSFPPVFNKSATLVPNSNFLSAMHRRPTPCFRWDRKHYCQPASQSTSGANVKYSWRRQLVHKRCTVSEPWLTHSAA
jgi:hypothetical protein